MKRTNEFQSIRSEGGLLPPDLLRRVLDPREKLPGTLPEDYGLPKGERLNEVITQSWNRLQKHWAVFPLLSEYSLGSEYRLADEALAMILIMKPNRSIVKPENGAQFSASPFLRFVLFIHKAGVGFG